MDGWKMAPPLPEPMGEIMGVSVSGKWYVVGGLDTKTHQPLGAMYLFDPSNGQWLRKCSMPVPAHHVAVAVVDNIIYVMGGFIPPQSSGHQRPPSEMSIEAGWKPTSRSWRYDP